MNHDVYFFGSDTRSVSVVTLLYICIPLLAALVATLDLEGLLLKVLGVVRAREVRRCLRGVLFRLQHQRAGEPARVRRRPRRGVRRQRSYAEDRVHDAALARLLEEAARRRRRGGGRRRRRDAGRHGHEAEDGNKGDGSVGGGSHWRRELIYMYAERCCYFYWVISEQQLLPLL